jgi:2-haloacid dehalogenase
VVQQPAVVVFDVNETLSDLTPLGARFVDLGVPEHLAPLWFAGVLRDGFALAAAGTAQPFARIASGLLRTMLASRPVRGGLEEAVAHVMAGFADLSVHPDVPDGLRRLRAAGMRLVTLSNGSADVADRLLTRAGVRDELEALLTVEDAGRWKPAAASYQHAVRRCGVPSSELMLVAVHPWDVDGAARAGLRTAWIDRGTGEYPDYLTPPELRATGVDDLAAQLGG